MLVLGQEVPERTGVMTRLTEPTRNLICDKHGCITDEPRTFYVHLDNGDVKVVTDVTGIAVTDTEVVLERGLKPPACFSRRDVYYACCDGDEEPPSLF